MNIDRGKSRHDGEAHKRITHCLDRLEAADEFGRGIDWSTEIVPGVTVEELIGAAVAAESKVEPTDPWNMTDKKEVYVRDRFHAPDLAGNKELTVTVECEGYPEPFEAAHHIDRIKDVVVPEIAVIEEEQADSSN